MENKNIIEQLEKMRCSAPTHGARIRAYIYDELPPEEVEAFDKHLDDCEKCSKIIYLMDYLQGDEIELLTRSYVSEYRSNGRAAAATH